MKEYKIYTGGKMSGIPYEQQMVWRQLLETCVRNRYDGSGKITFVHPPLYYNYQNVMHKSEKEILDWEMMQLHNCDLLVIDLNQIEDTIGTHIEIGAVQGINRFGDKYIYTIGVGDASELHPWIKEACNRIESNFKEAANYIVDYLLI